jgi:hypothetical protein
MVARAAAGGSVGGEAMGSKAAAVAVRRRLGASVWTGL